MLIVTLVAANPLTIRVAGEIDITNAHQFVEHVLDHAGGSLEVTLDLSELKYFDSRGVEALTQLKKRFGDGLHVIASPIVRRALEIVGLKDILLGRG